MKTWYTKQLAEIANVSVRTLHYYDKINLLKPSIRGANNYRLYSESDLLRLQQIVALKFFGFELSQVKGILSHEEDALRHFELQEKFLQQKAAAMLESSRILRSIRDELNRSKSIPWHKTKELIEVFQMNQQLENSWLKDIYNQQEWQDFVALETELKTQTKSSDKTSLSQSWQQLVSELNQYLEHPAQSEQGISMAEKFMSWVNAKYGKEYAHLRTKMFEQGFGEGKGLEDAGLTSASVAWLEQAMDAYWRDRIFALLDSVTRGENKNLQTQWLNLMEDMYGHEQARKVELIDLILKEEGVSDEAKDWLKKLQ